MSVRIAYCDDCDKRFEAPKETSRFCSRLCANRGVSRETAVKRGNKLRGRGEGKTVYRKRGGRHEHRVVAEEKIGRPLKAAEIVHHINGNTLDNRPENLKVLANQGVHAALHATKNRRCEEPGCDRKHAAKGMCMKHYNRAWTAERKGVMP